ncbi:DUF4139 domain-containing protein [Kitasatospora sp. RB6PN24]|uniref:DUF4139 domain-containing protein n=1 Tax=Kitasatospora humi TaxID=2893891 RepID=UPI001E2C645A|nr:DUF4139 domain-containing protein [Kitasatospora humi]MCC9311131.1 DUF4139 domain-containing protein [Kitasatospora humi]
MPIPAADPPPAEHPSTDSPSAGFPPADSPSADSPSAGPRSADPRTADAAVGTPTVLDAVVVHASGALCTRVAAVTLPAAGPVRLRLTGLPAVLEPGTVRARLAAAPAGWRITELRPSLEAAPSGAAEPTELTEGSLPTGGWEKVAAAAERVAALRLRAELLDARMTRTAELRAVPPEPATDRPAELRRAPVAALRALADFVDGRLTALQQDAEEVREELERAEREHSRLVDELERASWDRPGHAVEAGTAVLVTLAADDPALPRPTDPVTVEVEYRVPGASWVPAYQLSHRQDEAVGTLMLRAAVAQRTGEDWTGVRLALSTADLLRPAELPRLRSLRIGRRQPAPAPSGWREPPRGLDALFADYDRAPAPGRYEPVAVAAAAVRHTPHIAAEDTAAGAAPSPAPVPSPVAYGAPPPVAPGGYGAPPSLTGPPLPQAAHAPGAPVPQAPQAPGAPVPQAPGAPGPHRMRAMAAPAPGGAAPAPPPPPPPPAPPAPPVPAAELLDYAALTLAGPDSAPSRRGRLQPDGAGAGGSAAAPQERTIPPLPPHTVPPRRSAGSFDQRYDAASRVVVPSDGTWHTVNLTELPVSLTAEYVCVPAVDPAVYATLLLGNDTAHALLAGPLDVTVDGDFLLTTALPTLAPGARRRIGLGVAQSLRATRRTETQESTAGLRGGTTVVSERIHIELANHLSRPAVVEVRERIPVTAERDIRVDEQPADPAWQPSDDPHHPRGTRRWRVELAPGERTRLTGGYEIRFPAGSSLTGGNRRSG